MATRSGVAIIVMMLCSSLASCNAGKMIPLHEVGQIFNIMSFGAKPGKQDSSQALMKAWRAACDFAGPRARLFVPPGDFMVGEVEFAGPCKSRFPVVFQISGNLKAISDVSLYSGQGWMSFDKVDGLLITGGGTVDGQGPNVWKYNDCKNNGACVHLPASMHLNGMKNVKIKGLKFLNSMGFHIHISNSFQVSAHSLTITAPEDSPNTDGMHVSKSNSVKIARSTIGTGDDCISLGPGATNFTVNKVTCGPGHGISVGSLGKYDNELDVRGLIVKNCTLQGTTNGLRIKTYAGSGPSAAAGMIFKDIVMENVQNPIIIDQHYGSSTKTPSQVSISDIVYENIRGTSASEVAISLDCSEAVPCKNLHFSNINLKAGIMKRKASSAGISSSCANAHVMSTGPQFPTPCSSPLKAKST